MSSTSPDPKATRIPVEAAATYTGISASTLNKLRVFGGGPAYIKLGRRVVYSPEDLDDWIASNRRRSTSDVKSGVA